MIDDKINQCEADIKKLQDTLAELKKEKEKDKDWNIKTAYSHDWERDCVLLNITEDNAQHLKYMIDIALQHQGVLVWNKGCKRPQYTTRSHDTDWYSNVKTIL